MISPKVLALALCFLQVPRISAQETGLRQQPTRDEQAMVVVSRALGAAGSLGPSLRVADFTAHGSITYFWAGESVAGRLTLRGRGADQFRLEATLPGGVKTYVLNGGRGLATDTDGKETRISRHNATIFGKQMFPAAALFLLQQDRSTSLSYVGVEIKAGTRTDHIRATRPAEPLPDAIKAAPWTMDFFIDSANFSILSTEGTLDVAGPPPRAFPYEVRYADYRAVNGVLVPFSMSEFIQGQPISEIQLNDVVFNTGLGDADFHWQETSIQPN